MAGKTSDKGTRVFNLEQRLTRSFSKGTDKYFRHCGLYKVSHIFIFSFVFLFVLKNFKNVKGVLTQGHKNKK